MFPGLDGLMSLSRREGVDIRPTLLRVITDLYVQTERHTDAEEEQFVELASRLIDQVDDSTRAMVRARLADYRATPWRIAQKLAAPTHPTETTDESHDDLVELSSEATSLAQDLLNQSFFAAPSAERLEMLQRINDAPPQATMRPTDARCARALVVLEAAAFAGDIEGAIAEFSAALLLPVPTAAQIVSDPGGEALACAAKALGMPSDIFQRVLMFLDRERGSSVAYVYRLSRLYDALSIHAARSVVASWRGASFTQARAKHQSMLHDDERHRARASGEGRAVGRAMPDTSRRVRSSERA